MRELTRSNVISCFIWTSYYFPSKPIKKEFSLRCQSMLYWNADFSLVQNSPLKTTNTFFSLFFSFPFWGNVLCSGIISSEIPIFPIISKGPNWNILSTFWTEATSSLCQTRKGQNILSLFKGAEIYSTSRINVGMVLFYNSFTRKHSRFLCPSGSGFP